jgi:hypothetical protein
MELLAAWSKRVDADGLIDPVDEIVEARLLMPGFAASGIYCDLGDEVTLSSLSDISRTGCSIQDTTVISCSTRTSSRALRSLSMMTEMS